MNPKFKAGQHVSYAKDYGGIQRHAVIEDSFWNADRGAWIYSVTDYNHEGVIVGRTGGIHENIIDSPYGRFDIGQYVSMANQKGTVVSYSLKKQNGRDYWFYNIAVFDASGKQTGVINNVRQDAIKSA